MRRVVESLSCGNFDAGRFRVALGMVEGTFIDLREANPGTNSRQRLVVIRDPSVRDYLWARLEAVDGEAELLLKRAVFFEQCVILYEGRNHANSMRPVFRSRSAIKDRNRDVVNHEAVADRALDLIDSINPVVSRTWNGSSEYFERAPMSLDRRSAFFADVFAGHRNSRSVAASAQAAFGRTINEWEEGRGSLGDALELLSQATDIEGLFQEDVLGRAERALFDLITNRLQQVEDFEALVGLATLKPDLFMEPESSLESWGVKFEEFLEGHQDWLLEEIEDPDWLREEMRVISQIALSMGVDILELEGYAESRVEELREGREPEDEDDMPELETSPQDESEEAEIDALFQSLR